MEFKDYIIYLLQKNNYEAFFVGGCVRNKLLNIPISDYDITTNARPLEIKKIFNKFKIVDTGIKYGSVTIIFNDEKFEITTYRIEKEYINNRKPKQIEFTNNLKNDLKRRDFTINALCFNADVGYIDYFNGISDINNKIIRCIGIPDKRFNEDALRMLRAIRFAYSLNFDIDDDTKKAIFKNKYLLKNISIERIKQELFKIINLNNYIDALIEYKEVFEIIIPNINLKFINANINIKLSILLKNYVGKNIDFLKLDKKNKNKILFLINNTDTKLENKYEIKKLLSYNKEYFKDLLIIKNDKNINKLYNDIIKNKEVYLLKDLAITSFDLINLGFKNYEISLNLKKALDFVMKDCKNNDKNLLIEYLKTP